ncbi:uncharacterized protein LOC141805767 [Halichoeres trimaculatus]|uniref:uncharacterized protein LOC141805767 n=1 Tax=Halichoeres trimaculatus TaxID=147232 RepID=UPI003D9EA6F4
MAEENTNTTSEYEYIISKSILTRSGTPAVYQLTPETKNIGTLRRITLGNKNLNKTNRTVLLVGETGAGKTTMINALVNYAIGVKWEDNIWFEIVEEKTKNAQGDQDKEKGQCESQTSDVIVYEIFGFEDKTLPYSLTIIDTPGYGDTRGTEQDDEISRRLFDLFRSEDGVHEINVVGLVLKASENRLSDRLRYIFDSVVSLFGKNLEENLITLITHSDGITPENALKALEDANLKCAKDEDNEPVYFMFNNHQIKQKTRKNKTALKCAWDLTNSQMEEFTEFLKNSKPRSLITTVEVLNSRIRLTACIQNLQERVELIELKQKEIQQTQDNLKKHEEEMKSNQNYTVLVDEPYKEKEKFGGGMWALMFYKGAVCCNKCEENCHYPGCTMAWYPRDCEVMSRGHCTACTNKCPVSDHVKEDMIYVTKTRKVKRTLQDVKAKYKRSKADCEKTSGLLEDMEKTKEELQKEKDQWLDEAFQHVVKLEQIALNVDSLSIHVHLDFLIEKMKERGDTEKVQKLEEMKSKADEGTKSGLRYRFGKMVAACKSRFGY